ncbi:hypothetical protein CcaverHIS002_0702090 [Cutaneotrichosporon cavernicola]|nr:hypothetical protein CcaverHIS002_0702090 [Cutaneotrichosporon cavernicola]
MSTEDYDEFGNYIGGDLDSDDDSDVDIAPAAVPSAPGPAGPSGSYAPLEGFDDEENDEPMDEDEDTGMQMTLHGVDGTAGNQVVLHEDKKYYATAEETYGPDVEAMVQEEDTQLLTEPIVQPIKVRNFTVQEKDLPVTRFDRNFMVDMLQHPDMSRNVMVAGHIHHGKTSLLDMLVFETHQLTWDADRPTRYTDTHVLERAREMSMKCGPMTLVLPDSRGKSSLINLLDTPGHLNFMDEVACAARLTDGVVLVVDVIEGVMAGTETVIRHAMQEGLPLVLVVNKMDRLIVELRLPPSEAFFKVKHTIEEVNSFIASIDPDEKHRLSPERGNVAFASTQMGWCFTLNTFAQMYADTYGALDVDAFAKRLWGNIYFDAERRKFVRNPADPESKRSFVHFILEPLYKLYTTVLSEDTDTLKETLTDLRITLKPAMFKMDVRPLLKVVTDAFFGPSTGLVDMMTKFLPSPVDGAASKVERSFTGPLNTPLGQALLSCDANGPTVVQVTKLFMTTDAQEFRAFGRVMSGKVSRGQPVYVLGEGYSLDDEEDMVSAIVEGVMIDESRYNVDIETAYAGNLVLLSGVDASINKTATIYERGIDDDMYIFKPIRHFAQPVLKVAVEPVAPSELPKMLDGLRKVNKSYPLVQTKVEESGEHIILGTGEIYVDSVLHDLRKLFSEIEIKVSDPVTKFCETVVETSALKCYAETPNKKNKLTMISEPLESGIAKDIESGKVTMRMTNKERGKFFEQNYGWDLLASRNIWAFGPEDNGPNVLVNDTLPSEVDTKLLTNPIYRGGGQIIPTARRVCYSSMLLASPRLLEPVYYVEVQAPADCVAAVYTPGSPLYTVKAYIPVLDANGFETDLRTATMGQAFPQMTFDHWQVVPGDPTDKTIQLRPLEPAQGQDLARDLVLKTRRRKGLSDSIAVAKYLDDDLLVAISASNPDLLG